MAQDQNKIGVVLALGAGMGVAIGAGIGAAMENMGVGVAIGAIGAVLSAKKKD